MDKHRSPPALVLLLLSAAAFMVAISVLMLGPLVVELAKEFHASVAIAGQLAAATAITWAVTAPLAGPVSDAYGRRLTLLTGLLLMGLGILGSTLAWNYGSLLGLRLLTGVGGGMIGPSAIATISDIFPPEGRGKAIGSLVSAHGFSTALGIPMVALLLDLGGWRMPFYVFGVLPLLLWVLLWVWCPRSQRQPGRSLAFFSHYKEAGSSAGFWYILAVNILQQMAFFGVFGYLAANLIQTFNMKAGETVLPLALAGVGVVAGGFIGGRVADHRRRLALVAIFCLGSGLLAGLIFTTNVSPWATVALAFGAAGLLRISWAVTPVLLFELAGRSPGTATGMFAVSNHLGALGGASIGGLMLALGGFPLVGIFCLGAAVSAAVVVSLKVRDSPEFLQRMALPKGETG